MENLYDIICKINDDVSLPLFSETYTIPKDRVVYQEIACKYDNIANTIVDNFKKSIDSLQNIEDFIKLLPDKFNEAMETGVDEISKDAMSLGDYSLDANSIKLFCADEGYFDDFILSYVDYCNCYIQIIEKLSNSIDVHGIRSQVRSINAKNVVAGTVTPVACAFADFGSKVDASINKRILFQDSKKREILFNNLYKCALRLRFVITNLVYVRNNIEMKGWASKNDSLEAESLSNNVQKFDISDEEKKEIYHQIFQLNPFEKKYYYNAFLTFIENRKEILDIANFFSIDLKEEIQNYFINYVNERIGTTEEQAYKCRENLEEIRRNLFSEQYTRKAFEIIDAQIVKLDLVYRTVNGIVYPTRDAADKTRNDFNTYKELLCVRSRYNTKSEFLAHIQEIASLPIDTKIKEKYAKEIENAKIEFDKKCVEAIRYQYRINHRGNRFWNGDKPSMITCYVSLGLSIILMLIFHGLLTKIIFVAQLYYILIEMPSSEKSAWEDVTQKGKMPLAVVINEKAPIPSKNPTDKK